jgi:hypothetical protein
MTTKTKKVVKAVAPEYVAAPQLPTMKVVYDIKAMPKGLSFDVFAKIYDQHHLILWDSATGGIKPKLYGSDDDPSPLRIVDLEGKEIDIDFFTREFIDKEYWAKELHNCKNSPIYFFSNYGTTKWPHTSEDLKDYLRECGLGEVLAKDDEHAKKLWDAQKEKLKEIAKDYSIELLKERKGALEVERTKYEQKVVALEKLLVTKVKLVDDNNIPLPKRQAVGNIVEKLRKILPVDARYSEKYRTAKGKWDAPMLFVTNYDMLLEMYYEILKSNGKIGKELLDSPAGISRGAIV